MRITPTWNGMKLVNTFRKHVGNIGISLGHMKSQRPIHRVQGHPTPQVGIKLIRHYPVAGNAQLHDFMTEHRAEFGLKPIAYSSSTA